jgi:sialic acid synthase SpsE
MAKIILDFGSGNTNKNDWDYTKRMIDELKAVDKGKHEVVIKWQLFKEAGKNIPLDRDLFTDAYLYAWSRGLPTTASVFDKASLDFLLQFDVPFVKIANNRNLDWLIGKVPRDIPVYVSYGNQKEIGKYLHRFNNKILLCVSEYPATLEKYEERYPDLNHWVACEYGISDHTTNFDLWRKYFPQIVEWHYGLEDSTGLDAGPFVRTPTMLKEVL